MGGGDLSLMSGMVDKGWLGRKSRQGFYTYAGKKGKTLGPEVRAYLADFAEGRVSALGETEIQDRIAARLVNEAATCLQDEVIRNPGDGDVGLVLGIGFAPFKVGPFRYLDAVEVASCVDRMHGLAETLGPQFEPCQLLKEAAATAAATAGTTQSRCTPTPRPPATAPRAASSATTAARAASPAATTTTTLPPAPVSPGINIVTSVCVDVDLDRARRRRSFP
jgi:3-hydroxyacyl-CoA dehydrogenase